MAAISPAPACSTTNPAAPRRGRAPDARGGVELLFDIRDLAVVGAVEAVHSLRTLWTVYRMLLAEVERAPVDAVVLIDFPGFNLKLAKALAQHGIPVLYYMLLRFGPGTLDAYKRFGSECVNSSSFSPLRLRCTMRSVLRPSLSAIHCWI